MFCPLHSNINKEQHKKHLWYPSSHCGNTKKNWLMRRTPYVLIHENHNTLFSAMSNSFHNIVNNKKCLWSICLSLKPLNVHRKLSLVHGEEERMIAQRGTKVAPWCKHCSCCSWWKVTFQHKETLISKGLKALVSTVSK